MTLKTWEWPEVPFRHAAPSILVYAHLYVYGAGPGAAAGLVSCPDPTRVGARGLLVGVGTKYNLA